MSDIVEGSYYRHDEHGRVKVVDVTNGVVSFEKHTTSVNTTVGKIPGGATQSVSGFLGDTEPADVTINVQPALFGANATEP